MKSHVLFELKIGVWVVLKMLNFFKPNSDCDISLPQKPFEPRPSVAGPRASLTGKAAIFKTDKTVSKSDKGARPLTSPARAHREFATTLFQSGGMHI